MTMTIQIRKAKQQDWETMQKLNNEVFVVSYEYDKNLNMNWPYSPEGIKYYKDAIENENYCCYIAEIEGKPVGYLIGLIKNFSYRANQAGEIENIGVTQEFRGKGIGAKLVDEFKKWCKSRGINFVKVSTYFGYERGINFYKKQGLIPLDVTLEGEIKL